MAYFFLINIIITYYTYNFNTYFNLYIYLKFPFTFLCNPFCFSSFPRSAYSKSETFPASSGWKMQARINRLRRVSSPNTPYSTFFISQRPPFVPMAYRPFAKQQFPPPTVPGIPPAGGFHPA